MRLLLAECGRTPPAQGFGQPVYNSDAFLITGIVLGLFGGYLPCSLTAQAAEFQFPDRQEARPVVAEHGDIEFASFDVLFGDGGSSEPVVNRRDALGELLVRISDRRLRSRTIRPRSGS